MTRRGIQVRRVIGLMAATLLLAGCGATSTPPAAPGNEPAAPGGQANMITDVKGRTVAVNGPPERVVCLVSLCEDMLLELGMRPVAVTGELISHPVFLGEEGKSVPTVPGGFLEPDVEAIIGYQPDLVIGLFQQHDGLAPALDGVAPLWIIESNSIEDSIGYLRNMGTLTGRTAEAAASEQKFRDRLAAAEGSATKNLKAGVLIGLDGDFEVITGSYLSEVMERLFTYPFKMRTPGPIGGSPYSLEEMVAINPDILFVLSYNVADPNGPPLSEVLAQNPLWGQLKAVQTGAVHEVDKEIWGQGRGTRSLAATAEEALQLAGATP